MISVDQALQIVLDHVGPLGVEQIVLERAAGRVLAEHITADLDLPPFDRARMDGFAVRSEDVIRIPVSLSIAGEVAAGSVFPYEVSSGQAVKIYTGAPVPRGADAVQKVEVTETNDGCVIIREPVARGQYITPRASEVRAGEVIARSGLHIAPPVVSALASFGYSTVSAGVRPRVAILATGSELIEVSHCPTGSEIRNSNSYTLAAYAEKDGAIVNISGVVEDSLDATRQALNAAAAASDVVITSGGVSMGEYDLVKAALADIGAEIFFDKVSIRPGKPIVFGRREGTWFFGLPGNPVSTSVTYNVFVRPAIRRLQGDDTPLLPTVIALAASDIKDSSSRRSYLPGRLSIEDGRAMVAPLKWGGSSDLAAFMRANALIIVAETTHVVDAGQLVSVLILEPQLD